MALSPSNVPQIHKAWLVTFADYKLATIMPGSLVYRYFSCNGDEISFLYFCDLQMDL